MASEVRRQPPVTHGTRVQAPMPRRYWFMLAGAACSLGVGTWLTRRETALNHVRAPVCELDAVANAEGRIRLGASGDGRLTVLDFFAGWCSDCAEGVPRLERLPEAQAVRWISVGVDRSSEVVRMSAEQWQLRRPVVFDHEREAADAYGINAYPTLVIIDARGLIVAAHIGPTTSAAFVASLTRALRASG